MKTVVKAVFVISFFTFIDRVLGFLFKIYLSQQLGATAIGVYQVALSLFFVLLAVITSGIPLIVSKLTAKYRLQKDLKKEASLASAAVITSLCLSFALCLVILIFNRLIGRMFADDRSRTILLWVLPALVFSSVYSALRGNLWGRHKYTVTSLLELSEQVARIALCILLFAVGFDKLNAAALSLSLSCLVSALACTIYYFASGARLKNPKGHFKTLIKPSMPVTASRASTSAISAVVAVLVPFLLSLSGYSREKAMFEYGYSIGMALPMIYIPLTIVGSLAYVMIPSLSEAVAAKDNAGVKRQIEGAIKYSLVLGALFFPLFYALGEPLGVFLYKNTAGAAEAGLFLKKAAWLLIPISIESITSSMMNSIDMEIRGFIHYLIGSLVMFAIFFAFAKNFSMEIVSIGMGISWLIASLLNLWVMRKKLKIGFGFILTLIVSCSLCVPTVFLTRWLYNLFETVPMFLRISLSGGIGLLFIIILNFVFGLLRLDYFFSKKTKQTAAKTVA